MNKLKMLVLMALAAATVAIGAMSAAPSSAAATTTSGFRCHTEVRVEFGKAYLVVVCR